MGGTWLGGRAVSNRNRSACAHQQIDRIATNLQDVAFEPRDGILLSGEHSGAERGPQRRVARVHGRNNLGPDCLETGTLDDAEDDLLEADHAPLNTPSNLGALGAARHLANTPLVAGE